MRRWLWLLVVAAAAAGCARAQEVRYPNPLPFASADPAAIQEVARQVLTQLRFDIVYPPSREGRIETLPLTGDSWFEFWRNDTRGSDQVIESSLYTIRRRVVIDVSPAKGTERGSEVLVKVTKQRMSAPLSAPESVSQGFDIYHPEDTELTRQDELAFRYDWLDRGRDEALEQYILQRIQLRLGEPAPK